MTDTEVFPAQQSKWDEAASSLASEQQNALRRNLKVAQQVKPDEHAHALEVAARNGVALPVAQSAIRGGLDVRQADGQWDKLFRESPTFAAWMRDPNNAALAQDDREALSKVLKAAQGSRDDSLLGLGNAIETGYQQLSATAPVLAAAKGLITPQDAAKQIAAVYQRIEAAQAQTPEFAQQAQAVDQKESADIQAQYRRMVDGIQSGDIGAAFTGGVGTVAETIQGLVAYVAGNPRGAIYTGVETFVPSLPPILYGAAGVAVAGPAGLAAGVGIGELPGEFAGRFAEQMQKRGVVLTDEASVLEALLDPAFMAEANAAANRGAVTTAGIDAALAFTGGRNVSAAKGLKAKAAAAAQEVLVQAGGEAASAAGGDLAASGDVEEVDVGAAIFEGVATIGQSVAEVGIGTLARRAEVSPRQVVETVQQAVQAVQDAEALTVQAEAVQEAKTHTRSPVRTQQLVDAIAGGAGVADVQIAIEGFDRVYSKEPGGPVKAATDLLGPAGEATYHEAHQIGHLSVPVGLYESKLGGTPEWESLKPDVRVRPGGLTLKEADESLAMLGEVATAALEEQQTLFQEGKALDDEAAKLPEQIKAAEVEVAAEDAARPPVAPPEPPGLAQRIADAVFGRASPAAAQKDLAAIAADVPEKLAGHDLIAFHEAKIAEIQGLLPRLDEASQAAAQAEIGTRMAAIAETSAALPVAQAGARERLTRLKARQTQIQTRKAEIATEQASAGQDAADALLAKTATDLIQAGRGKAESRLLASVWVRALSTISERYGMSLEAMSARFGLAVERKDKDTADVQRETLAQAERGSLGIRKVGSGKLYTLTFYKEADKSTFLHETGHALLDIMGDLSADAAAPQQLRDDYAATLAYLGAVSRETLSTEHHEKWARSFEAYLREGKAPSPEVRRMFATFKAWLTKLYRDVTGLGVTLTPEVRGIMDRLLASDEEIAAAEYESGADQALDPEDVAQLEPDAQADYWAAFHAAGDQAREQVQMALLKEISAESRKAFEAAVQDAKPAIRAQIDALPGPAALDKMRAGTFPKLDIDAAAEVFSLSDMKALDDAGALGAGGIPPDAAREMLGFDSIDRMARDLTIASHRDALVDAAARAKVASEAGRFMSPAELKADAKKATRSAQYAAKIRAELDVMNTLANASEEARRAAFRAVPSIQNLRAYADAKIAATAYRDIKPGQWLSGAKREARASKAAMQAGKYQDAAEAKARELLHFEMHRIAANVKEEMATDARVIGRMDGDARIARLGKADPSYRDRMADILAHYGFRETGSAAPDQRGALDTLLNTLEAQERRPLFDSTILAGQPANWRTMTQGPLHDIRLAVEQLWHAAKFDEFLLTDARNQTRAAREAEMLASLEVARPEREVASRLGKPQAEKDKMSWNGAIGMLSKVTEIARQADDEQEGGAWWQTFVRPFNRAADTLRERRGKIDAQRARLKHAAFTVDQITDMETGKAVAGVPELVSHADRLMVLLNMGNQGNLDRLIGVSDPMTGQRSAGTLTPEEAKAIVAQATPADLEYVQGIWDLYEAMKPDVFSMQERITGVRPVEVAPIPVRVGEVTLRGGYFPIVYGDVKGSEMTEAQRSQELGRAATGRAMTAHGHTEARQSQVNRPLSLDLSVIDRTLDQVLYDLTHREALIDANAMLARDDVKAELIARMGRPAYDQIKAMLGDIATNDTRFYEQSDRLQSRVRRGISAAILGAKMTTALVNTSGFVQSVNRVGGGDGNANGAMWMARAASQMGTPGSFTKIGELIDAKSKMMRDRASNLTREQAEDARLVSSSDGDKARNAFNYYLYGRTQVLVDRPTWYAAYLKALDGGKEEADAVDIADSVVREAQGSGDLIDLAAIQRGSEWKKWATIFYHYSNTTLARTSASWRALKLRDPATYGRFLADNALLYALPAAMTTVIGLAFSGARGDKDDDETLLAKTARTMVSSYLGLVPIIRNAAGALFYGRSGGPETKIAESLAGVGKQIINAGDPDKEVDWIKAAQGVNMLGGIWRGYGADAINHSIEGFAAWMDGKAGPAAVIVGPPRKR